MRLLLPLFKFFDNSVVGNWVSDSRWLFPAIEAVHIVALALLFGAILMLNLRLLGMAQVNKPIARLARDLAPWVLCSLIIILASGFLLFSSEPMKSYASEPFRVKMLFLIGAIVFHYTVYGWVTRREAGVNPVWNKVAAVVSILLWLGVGIGGRGIGFL
jgi:hypothetical protein